MGRRTGKWLVNPSHTRSVPPRPSERLSAPRGCFLLPVSGTDCVGCTVPHFILTTLKSVFLCLLTGEETEAKQGDAMGPETGEWWHQNSRGKLAGFTRFPPSVKDE